MIPGDLTVRRRLARIGAIGLAVILFLAGIWLGGHPSALPPPLRTSFLESRSLVLVNQAMNILTTRYYRPLKRSDLVDTALAGMMIGLDDPYSRYVDPQAYRDRNQPPPTGGIGITTEPDARGVRVLSVVERSPAAGAGLRSGDLIIKVGATSLAGQADTATDLIRGPVGTSVELTFLRDDVEHVISLERAVVVVPEASWEMVTYHHRRIAHLILRGFSEHAGEELRAQVDAAQRRAAQALILDLRGNGGGLISEAVNVASAFIAHGTIMSAEERGKGSRVYPAEGNAIAAHIPMVVLVDHGTASSAEIVTAALQDNRRAEVVGTETYGKGVFQVTESLINGGALDITVGKYFTPKGENLGGGGARPGRGITPNVYAADDPNTPSDEALAAAERTVAAELP